MIIINNALTSEAGSTDVYSQIETTCRNPKCIEFGGNNLKKPKKSMKEKKVKVN